MCGATQCVPVADGGGTADQQFIRQDVVVDRTGFCLSALCWDWNKIIYCHCTKIYNKIQVQ